MQTRSIVRACTAAVLIVSSNAASSAGLADQWYIGIGGGASLIEPDPLLSSLNIDEDEGQTGTLFIGRDIDSNLSGQIQFSSFGEAELNNNSTVPYMGVEASMLYRFLDTRELLQSRGNFGLSIYGRIGLGIIDRDTEIDIRNNTRAGVAGGAGVEMYLSRHLALRAEAIYHAEDLTAATLSIVGRFGGDSGLPQLPSSRLGLPNTEPSEPEATSDNTASDATTTVETEAATDSAELDTPVSTKPASAPSAEDRDGDGVPNADDVCLRSAAGFPVRANGCPVFDGVLSGVRFVDGTAELLPESFTQLDFLIDLLKRYPQARIEMIAHTDDRGTVRDQSIITRGRLRSVGTYLVQNGIRSNRLVLRSLGGTRPLYDNSTADGRSRNNRIVVLEKTE